MGYKFVYIVKDIKDNISSIYISSIVRDSIKALEPAYRININQNDYVYRGQ